MIRKFCALLVVVGLGIAVAGMACADTQKKLDKADEGDAGT
jgi:hypothetical protein